ALAELAAAVKAHGDSLDRSTAQRLAPSLRAELLGLCERQLAIPGFFVVSGLDERVLPKESWRAAFRAMVLCVGEFYPQDHRLLEVKEVRDRGLTLDDKNARYSDGRHGGELHTDGAERGLPVPDLFALMCVGQGISGGAFQALSAYALHNRLLERH